jgi:hypothetical protein
LAFIEAEGEGICSLLLLLLLLILQLSSGERFVQIRGVRNFTKLLQLKLILLRPSQGPDRERKRRESGQGTEQGGEKDEETSSKREREQKKRQRKGDSLNLRSSRPCDGSIS